VASTKNKVKDKIDGAAAKAKELTDQAAEKARNAAKTVGRKVRKTGEKIEERAGDVLNQGTSRSFLT